MKRRAILVPLLAVALLTHACQTRAQADLQRQKEELYLDLLRFSIGFSHTVSVAADRIRTESGDLRIARNTVEWKLITIPLCRNTVVLRDPVRALVDLWCLCTSLETFCAGDDGLRMFGKRRDLLLAASKQLTVDIKRIAQGSLDEKLFDVAQRDVASFSSAHPVAQDGQIRVLLPSAATQETANYFQWIDRLPLSLSSLVGLDKSAQAIEELARAADRFTNMAAQLPDQLQWNTELLLLDLDLETTTQDLTTSSHEVAQSATRLSTTADRWPADAERVLQAALAGLEGQHPQIQADLLALQAAAETVHRSVDSAQATVQELARMVDSTAPLAQSVQETAAALVSATSSIERTSGLIFAKDEEAAPTSEPAPESRPFDITEYTAAAAQVEQASDEIRALLEDLKQYGASEEFDAALGQVEGRTRETVDHTSGQARSLVDHVTLRAIQLVAVMLAAGLLFVMIRGRMRRDERQKSARIRND